MPTHMCVCIGMNIMYVNLYTCVIMHICTKSIQYVYRKKASLKEQKLTREIDLLCGHVTVH